MECRTKGRKGVQQISEYQRVSVAATDTVRSDAYHRSGQTNEVILEWGDLRVLE